jgi:amidohydrolase
MKLRFVIVFSILGSFLFSCEGIPENKKRQKKRKVVQKVVEKTELPWTPPLNLPDKDSTDEQNLPKYLRARHSRFSHKMWKMIRKNLEEIIGFRRYLHSHPELAHREVKTGRYLEEQLKNMGWQIQAVGLTGKAAVLIGEKDSDDDKSTIAAIAGMDGSPGSEQTGLGFSSREFGYWQGNKIRVSHQFGKDVEMSILLGAAKILGKMRKQINGKVVLLFQPASSRIQSGENKGAKEIINSGILTDLAVESLIYLPLDSGILTGKIGVPTGAVHGGLTKFTIVVEGTKNRICSGSVPWKCVDPIAVASHMVQELLMLPTRKFGPNRQVILNIGKIQGGESHHLMASKVVIGGTFRWLVGSDRRKMERYIKRLKSGISEASGTNILLRFEKGPQLSVGNTKLTSWALPTLVRSLGRRGVLPADPLSDPGDFVLYHKELPTAMFLLGCSKIRRYAGKRGTSVFKPDEEVVSVGVHVLVNLIMDYFYDPNRPAVPRYLRKRIERNSRKE